MGTPNTVVADWLAIGQHLGVDFTRPHPARPEAERSGCGERIDARQWVKGCDHELEHWQTVGGNPITIARIALDHLREDTDYYKKLERMEAS